MELYYTNILYNINFKQNKISNNKLFSNFFNVKIVNF